jgi:hypothetical protein
MLLFQQIERFVQLPDHRIGPIGDDDQFDTCLFVKHGIAPASNFMPIYVADSRNPELENLTNASQRRQRKQIISTIASRSQPMVVRTPRLFWFSDCKELGVYWPESHNRYSEVSSTRFMLKRS